MSASGVQTWSDTWADFRRSFSEFLEVPSCTIAAFMLLALGTYALDTRSISWIEGPRTLLSQYLLTSDSSTETLLATLAGGMMTLTSITFSLLLLAVQQSAGSMTTQVLDQFIRRRLNQWYFGVFVGVTLFTLITLAANTTDRSPVFSAPAALLLPCGTLVLLIILLYTPLNQMRANRILEAIHDLSLEARERQRRVIARTRSTSRLSKSHVAQLVSSNNNGYFAYLHLDRIAKAAGAGEYEVVLLVSLGDYVCYRDVIAEVRAATASQSTALATAVLHAVDLERQRNLHVDPGYGVTQLGTIGWTSTSTARSNPAPALACLRNLRDLASRWSVERPLPVPDDALPVVYNDNLLEHVIDALESIGVAASESLQHHCAAEVLLTFAGLLERLPVGLQPRADDAVRRALSGLGDHVLTADLDQALSRLAETLSATGRANTEREVRTAHARLARTVGELYSRDSRVNAGQ